MEEMTLVIQANDWPTDAGLYHSVLKTVGGDKPQFHFIVTVETHGPYVKEAADAEGHNGVTDYRTRLGNAVQSARRLQAGARRQGQALHARPVRRSPAGLAPAPVEERHESETDPRLHQVPVLIASNSGGCVGFRQAHRQPPALLHGAAAARLDRPARGGPLHELCGREMPPVRDADAEAGGGRDPEPAVLAAHRCEAGRITPRRTCWPPAVPARRAPASASRPLRLDRDRGAHRGTQHHQAHDRGRGNRHAVAAHRDVGVEAFRAFDEFCRGAGMKAALVDDRQLPCRSRCRPRHRQSPRIWLATLMYLRPASCAAVAALSSGVILADARELHQHRKVQPGHHLHLADLEQRNGEVRGRAAEHVRQDDDARTAVHPRHRIGDVGAAVLHAVVRADGDGLDRPLAAPPHAPAPNGTLPPGGHG